MPCKNLREKIAVVTGAASGIGLALASAFSEQGARVAFVDIHEEVHEVAARFPNASAHRCDVSQRDNVERVIAEIASLHGGLHLLVNNAGISLAGRFEEASLEDFARVMEVNFWGAVYACRAALPHLRRAQEAQIVNVCSSFAWLGFAGKSAYSASKAALRAFSESLRAELSGTHIGVSLLFPGPVDTNLLRRGVALREEQREAEVKFLASRAVAPSLVAKRTLSGISKNSSRIVVSLDYRFLDALVRLSPSAAQALTARASRAMPF